MTHVKRYKTVSYSSEKTYNLQVVSAVNELFTPENRNRKDSLLGLSLSDEE